jgi:probable rRNA maturation factor
MIDVVNLQRKVRLNTHSIRAFVASLSAEVSEAVAKTFSVAFVSDKRMKQLNSYFRGKDSTTDVLSFPWSGDTLVPIGGSSADSAGSPFGLIGDKSVPAPTDFLGDIVISAEQAERQATENGLDLDIEIKQLILHGLLHLCGYDHETDDGEMDRREIELRKTLGIE